MCIMPGLKAEARVRSYMEKRMKHLARAAFTALTLCIIISQPLWASAQKTGGPGLITRARVATSEGAVSGTLYVTIGGSERKIADQALEAWIIEGGRRVVYSGRDGAGGFENEGQSLRIYDAATGRTRKIMSEYYGIDRVTEAKTMRGRTALLVEMSDGGLGASYFAVVDPARGEVFFRRWAKLLSRQRDVITLGFFREDDWGEMIENSNANVRPYKRERHNLNALLQRRVIYNKPDR